MKIALAHDYLTRFGGAERVLQQLHGMYPQAPIFTLTATDQVTKRYFPDADIRTSFLQRLPFSHRVLFPLLPFAVESLDVSDYDIVLSSSSALIKGLVTRTRTTHISYVHTPPRYLWEDRLEYARHHIPRGLGFPARAALHLLRVWDQQAATRVDHAIANSEYTRKRIERYYSAEADVITPPVDLTVHATPNVLRQSLRLPSEYFLLVSRLTWWKRAELVVDAFNALNLPLLIVGEGSQRRMLERRAGTSIRFMGNVTDTTVRQLMYGARALLHPSTEDFGITAVEAMAQGTPVISYREGGAMETVTPDVSGIFFDDAHPLAIANAVRLLRERDWDRMQIQETVQGYGPERFREQIRDVVAIYENAPR